MRTPDDYGNAGAYWNNSSNNRTAMYVAQSSGFGTNLGRNKVAAYSNFREASTPPAALTPDNRQDNAGSAIVGWCGLRPVAFPLQRNWNFDVQPD
jgi:hypothetical protein